MRQNFPLFSTPTDLSPVYWEKLLQKDDVVIDATIGNGKDTLTLCSIMDRLGGGKVIGIDIQKEALERTSNRINEQLPNFIANLELHLRSHEIFPDTIAPSSVKLIVYNLGYLPGGDKTLTTKTSTTLISIENALTLLKSGGCLSITCYPGHSEGEIEYGQICALTSSLCKETYCVCQHIFSNRKKSPVLILIQKSR